MDGYNHAGWYQQQPNYNQPTHYYHYPQTTHTHHQQQQQQQQQDYLYRFSLQVYYPV